MDNRQNITIGKDEMIQLSYSFVLHYMITHYNNAVECRKLHDRQLIFHDQALALAQDPQVLNAATPAAFLQGLDAALIRSGGKDFRDRFLQNCLPDLPMERLQRLRTQNGLTEAGSFGKSVDLALEQLLEQYVQSRDFAPDDSGRIKSIVRRVFEEQPENDGQFVQAIARVQKQIALEKSCADRFGDFEAYARQWLGDPVLSHQILRVLRLYGQYNSAVREQFRKQDPATGQIQTYEYYRVPEAILISPFHPLVSGLKKAREAGMDLLDVSPGTSGIHRWSDVVKFRQSFDFWQVNSSEEVWNNPWARLMVNTVSLNTQAVEEPLQAARNREMLANVEVDGWRLAELLMPCMDAATFSRFCKGLADNTKRRESEISQVRQRIEQLHRDRSHVSSAIQKETLEFQRAQSRERLEDLISGYLPLTRLSISFTQRMIQRLEEARYPYKLELRDGMLQAGIEQPKMKVTLFSQHSLADVGRIMMNGWAYWIGINGGARNRRTLPKLSDLECAFLYLSGMKPRIPMSFAYGNRQDPSLILGADHPWINGHSVYGERTDAKGITIQLRPRDDKGSGASKGFVILKGKAMQPGPVFPVSSLEEARTMIREAVTSARANILQEIRLDALIDAAKASQTLDALGPVLSEDSDLKEFQKILFAYLKQSGKTPLFRPHVSPEERAGCLEGQMSKEQKNAVLYSGCVLENVQACVRDYVDLHIGGSLKEPEVFHPNRVVCWMDSSLDNFLRSDKLAEAMRICRYTPGMLLGEGYEHEAFCRKLLRFDESTGVPLVQKAEQSEFFARIYEGVVQTLISSGSTVDYAGKPEAVLIDARGVIRYEATMFRTKMRKENDAWPVFGVVGQVFEPRKDGSLHTRFYGSEDSYILPGYTAGVLQRTSGRISDRWEERVRLSGYEDRILDALTHQVRLDMLQCRAFTPEGDTVEVGHANSLYGVYKKLYREKVSFGQLKDTGDLARARVDAHQRRVKLSQEFLQASISQTIDAMDGLTPELFGAYRHPYAVLGGESVFDPGKTVGGYFDDTYTVLSAEQGLVRVLAEGASVQNKRIVPGDDRSAVMKLRSLDMLKTCAFDPVDRQNMTFSNLLHCLHVSEPAGVLMANFGGWTQDDGMVVSSEFAMENGIEDGEGNRRPLAVGDKISDLHGNKGVISLVVDRNMSMKEAKERSLEEQVALFAANPNLDVVCSPYSPVSRGNAGTLREACEHSEDFVMADGSRHPHGIGRLRFIITDKTVDSKTNLYSRESMLQENRARKISPQLGWAFASRRSDKICDELFGKNTRRFGKAIEYARALGVSINPVTLEMSDEPSALLGQIDPEQIYFTSRQQIVKTERGTMNRDETAMEWIRPLSSDIKYMEVPFELKVTLRPGAWNDEPVTIRAIGNPYSHEKESWLIPVVDKKYRLDLQNEDGTMSISDLSADYSRMVCRMADHRNAVDRLRVDEKQTPAAREKAIAEEDARLKSSLESAFASIGNRLAMDLVGKKRNLFKEDVMSVRWPWSATILWSADPRLDIDQVALSAEAARKLDVQEDGYVLVWRDPVLRDSNVRYMRVKIDPDVVGMRINPNCAKCFDGDFDGDTIGVISLKTEAARQQAFEHFSMEANLLDRAYVRDGRHPIHFHNSQDVRFAQHLDKSETLARRFEQLEEKINAHYRQCSREGKPLDWKLCGQFVQELSSFYRDAYQGISGKGHICFAGMKDLAATFDSIYKVSIESGAKGNEKGFAVLKENFGFYQDPATGQEKVYENATNQSPERKSELFFATCTKQAGTGMAGKFSHRTIAEGRDHMAAEILEMTQLTTQTNLQIKKEADRAVEIFKLMKGPLRMMWQGRSMNPVRKDGKIVDWQIQYNLQATPEEWKRNMRLMISESMQIKDFNMEIIDRVAEFFSEKRDGRSLMRNIEKDRKGSLLDHFAYDEKISGFFKAAQEKLRLINADQPVTAFYMTDKMKDNILPMGSVGLKIENCGYQTDHGHEDVGKHSMIDVTDKISEYSNAPSVELETENSFYFEEPQPSDYESAYAFK